MRKIYVDEDGISNTVDPIALGERVQLSINGKVELEVIGIDSTNPTPCISCPLNAKAILGLIPRCPRLQLCGDDYDVEYDDDYDEEYDYIYDSYDYLCEGVALVSPGDVMEEL